MINGLPQLPSGYVSTFKHANLESIENERKLREREDAKAGYTKFDHMSHKPYSVH